MLTWAGAWLLGRRKDISTDSLLLLMGLTCIADVVIVFLLTGLIILQ